MKAKNKILEIPTFDVEFAMEEPKKAKKKTSRKEVQKTAVKLASKKVKGKNKPQVFDSVTLAAQYLTDLLDLKITNSKDCIYRALRGNGKTHTVNISKNEDNKIILEPIAE